MADTDIVDSNQVDFNQPWVPKYNPWLIAVVVALAAFMEVLDTSIANVALPHIAGNVGASNDESTWVLTSYLVSNAIVLPISGWIANRFGRKRFFMSCIMLFTVASLLCGAAQGLGMLILFRVIQGAGGGGLQPMAQAILADTFPPAKRGLAFALYGITAIMAPTIGPTLFLPRYPKDFHQLRDFPSADPHVPRTAATAVAALHARKPQPLRKPRRRRLTRFQNPQFHDRLEL